MIDTRHRQNRNTHWPRSPKIFEFRHVSFHCRTRLLRTGSGECPGGREHHATERVVPPPRVVAQAGHVHSRCCSKRQAVHQARSRFVRAHPWRARVRRCLELPSLDRLARPSLRLVLAVGPHSVTAIFAGTNTALGSNSAATVNVTGLFSTSTVLSSTGATGNFALSAAVSGAGYPTARGQVTFTDSFNIALGSATLAGATKISSFSPSVLSGTGSVPIPLAVGDFNGDGLPDIAVANFYPNSNGVSTLTVFLSTGQGSYSPPATIGLTFDAMNPSGLSPVISTMTAISI